MIKQLLVSALLPIAELQAAREKHVEKRWPDPPDDYQTWKARRKERGEA